MHWMDAAKIPGFLAQEVAGADFNDRRLTQRAQRISATVARAPSESFPTMCADDAELEGTYRFLSNPSVDAEKILAPHFRATALRVQQSEHVIVAHDTTEISFGPVARGDLDVVGHGKSYGFNAHVALAMTGDDARIPLGVLGLQVFNRTFGAPRLRPGENKENSGNPMLRWGEMVRLVRSRLGDGVVVTHVADSEADDYLLLSELASANEQFVVRQQTNRRVATKEQKIKSREFVATTTVIAEREIAISAHRKPARKTHASRTKPRPARLASLEIRAARMVLPRTVCAGKTAPRELEIHLVEVVEPNPPKGQDPIAWWLWTNLPIDTEKHVLAVVDAYCARWRVEEYFKALKSGCGIERRQLESKHALSNALAIFIPVAWRLLLLRSLARERPKDPCSTALTKLQILALRGYMKAKLDVELPRALDIATAMLAVAKLGGHIKNNGDPGWIVLGRGFDRLLDIELGLSLALGRSDQ